MSNIGVRMCSGSIWVHVGAYGCIWVHMQAVRAVRDVCAVRAAVQCCAVL